MQAFQRKSQTLNLETTKLWEMGGESHFNWLLIGSHSVLSVVGQFLAPPIIFDHVNELNNKFSFFIFLTCFISSFLKQKSIDDDFIKNTDRFKWYSAS